MKMFRTILACTLLFVTLSCSYKHPVLLLPSPSLRQPIEDSYVVLILMDGGRTQEIDKLIGQGRLPAMKELFYEQGARYQHAITVMPSVSMPSHQAMISGVFPGHQGMPNLDWFSRPLLYHFNYLSAEGLLDTSRMLFNFKQVQQDKVISDQPQLLYHDLKGYPSMAIFQTIHNGATTVLPSKIPLWTAYYGKLGEFYEQLDFESARYALSRFRSLPSEELPRFTYMVFCGMDLISHFNRSDSERVADLYGYYDSFLDELRTTLKQRGIWEKTTIIMVSDHGQHPLTKMTDQLAMFRRLGLYYSKNLNETEITWGDHGTALSNFNFKMGKDWKQRPTLADLKNYTMKSGKKINLIAAFSNEPDISLVVVPEGPWKTHLYFRDRHALVLKRFAQGKTLYAYRVETEKDPLDYLEKPEIRSWIQKGEFHDAEEWLAKTYDLERPDAVVLISQLFNDYREGDMMLFTVKESHFKEDRPSSHGSMFAEDMHAIMMLHGPRIKPGVYSYMRTVDLYPALLHLFGLQSAQPIDGVLRKELFLDLPARSLANVSDFRGFSGKQEGKVLSAKEFEGFLEEKITNKNSSKEERKKALQILDGVRSYRQDLEKYPMP